MRNCIAAAALAAIFSLCAMAPCPAAGGADALLSQKVEIPFETAKKWAGIHAHDKNAARALELARDFAENHDPRFASAAVAIFRAYADQYTKFRDVFYTSPLNGALFEQLLDEANWLDDMAEAYDILNRAGAVPEADRTAIEEGLFVPAADVEMQGRIHNNHQWWYDSAIGSVGFAIGRQDYVNVAVDGPQGFKKLIATQIDDDGLLYEESIAYHYYALRAFCRLADMAALHGVDLYSLEVDDESSSDGLNGKKSIKMMFDAALYFAFQDTNMPAIKDSGPQGRSFVQEYRDLSDTYRRHFNDPVRLAIMEKYSEIQKKLGNAHAGLSPVNFGDGTFALNGRNVLGSTLFPSTGYAILRADPDSFDAPSVNMTYGPYGGGHGHPDKLSISMYANHEIVLPDLGRYRYDDPLHQSWIKQTLSHNTVVVDERSQPPMSFEGMNIWAEAHPQIKGKLTDFISTPSLKLMRANSNNTLKGVTLDRTVVLYGGSMIDIMRATSTARHDYDYALHVNGTLVSSNIDLATATAPLIGSGFGYEIPRNVRTTIKQGLWTTVWKTPAGNGLVIDTIGDGHFAYVADTPGNPPDSRLGMLMLRQRAKDTAFITIATPLPPGADAGQAGAGAYAGKSEYAHVTLKYLEESADPEPAVIGYFNNGIEYKLIVSPGNALYSMAPDTPADARAIGFSVKSDDGFSPQVLNFTIAGFRRFGANGNGIFADKMIDYMEMSSLDKKIVIGTSEKNKVTIGKQYIAQSPGCDSASILVNGVKRPLETPAEIELRAGRNEIEFVCED